MPKRFSSAQMVNFREKLFLFDCGEGTQIQMRRYKQKFSRLNHIFISHLHGDHTFGLPGLISTLSLMGRRSTLHIHAHEDLEKILQPFLDYFMHKAMFDLVYHPFNPDKYALIYEDKSLEIYTIPLKHSAATAGFLLKEKPKAHNVKKEAINTFDLNIKDILKIKQGEDIVDKDGKIIPNACLARPPKPSRSFAYITDTAYKPEIAHYLKNVDLLYHEATFADEETLRVSGTLHSTGEQAARIAKAANAKRLLIGHFSSRYKSTDAIEASARAVFENTTAAKDGMRIEV